VQLAQDNNGVPGAIPASGTVVNSPALGATCCVGSIQISPAVPVGTGRVKARRRAADNHFGEVRAP
jgi:hypothetical protein